MQISSSFSNRELTSAKTEITHRIKGVGVSLGKIAYPDWTESFQEKLVKLFIDYAVEDKMRADSPFFRLVNLLLPLKEFQQKRQAEIGLHRVEDLKGYLTHFTPYGPLKNRFENKAAPENPGAIGQHLQAEIEEIEQKIPLATAYFKTVRKRAQVGMGLKITLLAATALAILTAALAPPLISLPLVGVVALIGIAVLFHNVLTRKAKPQQMELAERALPDKLPWGNLCGYPVSRRTEFEVYLAKSEFWAHHPRNGDWRRTKSTT